MNGRSSHPDRSSNHHPVGNQDEPEELKLIRKKHGHNLATIRELFPNWTDEDLLMALNEASGDLELAAARISEGQAADRSIPFFFFFFVISRRAKLTCILFSVPSRFRPC
jgi:hypothetical protein